jgi:hypothetical protein
LNGSGAGASKAVLIMVSISIKNVELNFRASEASGLKAAGARIIEVPPQLRAGASAGRRKVAAMASPS